MTPQLQPWHGLGEEKDSTGLALPRPGASAWGLGALPPLPAPALEGQQGKRSPGRGSLSCNWLASSFPGDP